jgi:hypothetical protein
MAPTYEILPGLPSYGPLHVAIPANSAAAYSEGFVVRFVHFTGTWVGNFAGGFGEYCTVVSFPETSLCVVVAYGMGYVVEPETATCVAEFGGAIQGGTSLGARGLLVYDHNELNIIAQTGSIWRSPRLSWEGITEVEVYTNCVAGLAYAVVTDQWCGFALNLHTHQLIGGAF